jgi:catechol 2,3-dioxygenase-like lactoylglutathione lyase family enzyme
MNLNQVTVPATDLSRAVDFYRALGLVLIVNDIPGYARFECPDGEATFSVERVNRPPVPGVVVYFECDDLDDRVAALELAGIAFETGPADQPWLWREARLRDPDGNAVCLFRAGRSRRFPPWRLATP